MKFYLRKTEFESIMVFIQEYVHACLVPYSQLSMRIRTTTCVVLVSEWPVSILNNLQERPVYLGVKWSALYLLANTDRLFQLSVKTDQANYNWTMKVKG